MRARLWMIGAGLLVTTLATSMALASTSRLESMGAGLVTIDDSANVLVLPSLLTSYPSLATLDGLTWSEAGARGAFGFHYGLTEHTVMAIYGGQAASAIGTQTSPTAGGSQSAASAAGIEDVSLAELPQGLEGNNPDLSADLWWGLMVGHDYGGIRVGGAIAVYQDSQEVTAPDAAVADMSALTVDANLGVGLDFQNDHSVDMAIGFAVSSFNYYGPKNETDYFTPYQNFGIDFLARGTLSLWENAQLVPYGQFIYNFQGLTDEYPIAEAGTSQPFGDYTHVGIEVGSDLRIQPADNIIVQPGIGIRADLVSVEGAVGTLDDDTRLALPYYGFGVDARVVDWLALRMGARQYIYLDTDASSLLLEDGGEAESETRTSSVATTFDTGFGLFFGEKDEWVIDCHLSPDFFLSGPYILTGNPTVGPGGTQKMNLDVSLSYTW